MVDTVGGVGDTINRISGIIIRVSLKEQPWASVGPFFMEKDPSQMSTDSIMRLLAKAESLPQDSPVKKKLYDDIIDMVFGEASGEAKRVLDEGFTDPTRGRVMGENPQRKSGKDADAENRIDPETGQYKSDAPVAKKYNPVKGVWEDSVDRGLFRINNGTFWDFMNRKPQLLMEYGIRDWDDMLDPYKNSVMAKVIWQEQGWNGWYAAPPDLKRSKPFPTTRAPVSMDYPRVSPTTTPYPTTKLIPTPTTSPDVKNIPNAEPKKNRIQRAFEDATKVELIDPTDSSRMPRNVGEKMVDFFKILLGKDNPRITQRFGVKNPSIEKFSPGGVNIGTDVAASVGTPVTLPDGNWKVVEAYNGANRPGKIGDKTNRGYGNSILVQNLDTGEKIRVSHLSEVFVSQGQTLRGGLVAKTGRTGNVTGPHLDIEYYDEKGRLSDITKRALSNKTVTQTSQPKLSKPTVSKPVTAQKVMSTPQSSIQRSLSPISPITTVKPQYTAPKSVPVVGAVGYTVKKGDTLSSIAARSGVSVSQLASANRISNPNLIMSGAKLSIPMPKAIKTTA